jgi:hypothetical protein
MKKTALAAVLLVTSCDSEQSKQAKAKAAAAAAAARDTVATEVTEAVSKGKEASAVVAAKARTAAEQAGAKAREMAGDLPEKSRSIKEAAEEKIGELRAAARDRSADAIGNFRDRLGKFHEWLAGQEGSANDLSKADRVMEDFMKNLKAVPTEGLPADLQTGFAEYQGTLIELQKVLATMPKEEGEALQKWEAANRPALETLNARMSAAVKGLQEAAARHGIPDLRLGE